MHELTLNLLSTRDYTICDFKLYNYGIPYALCHAMHKITNLCLQACKHTQLHAPNIFRKKNWHTTRLHTVAPAFPLHMPLYTNQIRYRMEYGHAHCVRYSRAKKLCVCESYIRTIMAHDGRTIDLIELQWIALMTTSTLILGQHFTMLYCGQKFVAIAVHGTSLNNFL